MYQANSNTNKDKGSIDMSFWLKALGIASFVGGGITLFIFILGVLLIRFRNCWSGCPFSFFGFSIGVLVMVTGIFLCLPNSF